MSGGQVTVLKAPQRLHTWSSISLDLEKASDAIDRHLVIRALALHDIDPNLLKLVHSWLQKYEYCIPHKELLDRFTASRGINQRSKDAPMLWTLNMYLVLHDLLAHHDMSCIVSHIIIYADDIHLRWIIHNMSMGYETLHELAFVLSTLKAYHFRVNLTKSVTIMRLVGKSAQAFLKRWTTRSKEGPRSNLPDTTLNLSLVGKTDYLGIVLSYRAFDHDTVQCRITAANICFRILRKWFLNRHHPFHLRIPLYNQCVLPTVSYGIDEIGISSRSFHSITGMIPRHHRTMARSPVHLTREPTTAFYASMNLEIPWLFLDRQQKRLIKSFLTRWATLMSDAMQANPKDVCVFTPAYPGNYIMAPTDTLDPGPQAPELKCPKCDRAFHQAGPWKRHLRACHQIPRNIEDLFKPLRDAQNGQAICRHCHKPFVDLYRLKAHINARVCLQFDRSKDNIVPIAARPSLRMHFRYKCILGLLLDKPLFSELAHHCAFCHLAIPARSIRKHYGEQHQGLLAFEAAHRDTVYGLANLGSGRGTCILCEQKSTDISQHQCGVLLQINILLGQSYDASHFPAMPTMIRPWNTGSEALDSGSHDRPPPNPSSPEQAELDPEPCVTNPEIVASIPAPKPTPLLRCHACNTTFLTEIGLIAHHAKFPQHASSDRSEASTEHQPQRPEHRTPRITVKHMLAYRPAGSSPVPARMYTCPLCKESIGRKALVSHLRKFHDVHQPDGFMFESQLDMHLGHLACKHCHAPFSMEIALRTHFQRASCPVLLCTMDESSTFRKAP